MKSIIKLALVLAVATSVASLNVARAEATPGPQGQRKVVICHATDAHSNPYTKNNVDKSSIDEVNNKYLNGHGDHEGAVWYPGIADHSWGDIIPPFTNDAGNSYPGQNWNEAGRRFYDNGCKYTPATPQVGTGITTTVPSGGNVLASSTKATQSKKLLADTGMPLVANFGIGASLLGATGFVTRRSLKLRSGK